MKITLFTLIAATALGLTAAAAPIGVSQEDTVNTIIPNADLNGIAETINLGSTGIQSISDVTVSLDISSGFNGNYYAYLLHDGDISVLLNRVGLDASNPYGYPDSGFQITLADDAVNGDIHTYETVSNPDLGTLTGTWQPDARNVSPFAVTTSTPRTAFLSTFDGGSADGLWTLFIADVSPGGVGSLDSWGIDVTGTGASSSVPERGNTLLLLAAAIITLLGARHISQRVAARQTDQPN